MFLRKHDMEEKILTKDRERAEKEENIVITQAKYLTSAVNSKNYPLEKKREIVFIGRSNVGKSSLINSLSRTKNLAHVSGKPGKTQTINFYDVGFKNKKLDRRYSFYLVDLPGYGYAKVGKKARALWRNFIREYLRQSEGINFVCQLIDMRHPPMPSDKEMFTWLVENNLSVLIIATKADKVGKTLRKRKIREISETFGIGEEAILPYSSFKHEGRSDLLNVIEESLH